jgi:trehalose 6-phosphate synthase
MYTYYELRDFLRKLDRKLIMVADAETRVHQKKGDEIVANIPAGGVSVALDPIVKAAGGVYIGRGKTEADREVVDSQGKLQIEEEDGSYTLKRIFITPEEEEAYYYGFSNQTLWPLCHVAFQAPLFRKDWYEGYKKVNQKFADAIKQELNGKSFLWINDYQLSLVPSMLNSSAKNAVIGMFWHIPWPTWEVFRILPHKKEILESLLQCDFLAFHRGYQARNFIETVERELEVRVDQDHSAVHYKNHVTTVTDLPMGIDTDVIRSLLVDETRQTFFGNLVHNMLGNGQEEDDPFRAFFDKYKVMVGVDRLDYTKGLNLRLHAIDTFLEQNPQYIGKVVYVGIVAPSREAIPSYVEVKKAVKLAAQTINKKYVQKDGWMPIYLLHDVFSRENIMQFYQRADLCLVTPRDDGMNLVSKEFVLASSKSENPGMLILSQFAGSAIDLTQAIIVNPYDTDGVAAAIKHGLEMDKKEKRRRTEAMVERLDEHNVYVWAQDFIKEALAATPPPKK